MAAHSSKVTRREFINHTAQAAAGLVAASTLASCQAANSTPAATDTGRILGANETINMAVIGVRNRGMAVGKAFAKIKNVKIAAMCDCDENLFDERVKTIAEVQQSSPNTVNDLRRVFDDKNIDAVIITMPNHWHALATIWACQAGKHVYVEKPCCHEIREGRKMIEAARKYSRVVTVGLQSRSIPSLIKGVQFLHNGGIGDIYMARSIALIPRESIGTAPDGPCKGAGFDFYMNNGKKGPCYDTAYLSKVNYDLWLGPAPLQPFNSNRFHYNWHWNWTYGNGEIGNNGPHPTDIAQWGMKRTTHPSRISSTGGYFKFKSDQQTPNMQSAAFQYEDGKILQIEIRNLYTNTEFGQSDGVLFYGTEGWAFLSTEGDGKWQSFLGRKNEPGPCSENAGEKKEFVHNVTGEGEDDHFVNYIAKLRDPAKPNHCDIEDGFRTTALPLLANISFRLGRDLHFNPKTETFVNDKDADAMLTRDYRTPFVVPETV
jgi:predicted dehydrogenase